jgi:nitrile hydratase
VNGVHDMGGMHNLGPLEVERDEPWFHHPWERRAFALTLATGALGEWNLDMSRFARERIPAAEYLVASYYEKWLLGMERLLVERGLVTPEEMDVCLRSPAPDGVGGRTSNIDHDGTRNGVHDRTTGAVHDRASKPVHGRTSGAGEPLQQLPAAQVAGALPARGHPRLLTQGEVGERLRRGSPTRVDADVGARFAAGDRIVTRNEHPAGHTRLPRYARGRNGVIERDHGVFVFADAHAMGRGPQPQHLYNVRFTAWELWGEAASARDSVCLDLWEAHLRAP